MVWTSGANGTQGRYNSADQEKESAIWIRRPKC